MTVKAVMITIRPKWCEKIASGEKTIEVRKNKPLLGTPFKCYICCTLPRYPHEDFITTDYPKPQFYGGGKVIGEFVCDRIFPIDVYDNGCIKDWNFECMWKACLPYEELATYIGREKRGYGWHISDLKIYDAPRELSEFVALRMCMVKNGLEVRPIDRPPQNWCYVEERDGSMEEMRYGDMQCCRCVHCSGMESTLSENRLTTAN